MAEHEEGEPESTEQQYPKFPAEHDHTMHDTTFTKVFVGGLPWETTSESLGEYFEQFGDLLEAVVIRDKQTARSRGYGFVTFHDADNAKAAVYEPNPFIDGRRANCNLAAFGKKKADSGGRQQRSRSGKNRSQGGSGRSRPEQGGKGMSQGGMRQQGMYGAYMPQGVGYHHPEQYLAGSPMNQQVPQYIGGAYYPSQMAAMQQQMVMQQMGYRFAPAGEQGGYQVMAQGQGLDPRMSPTGGSPMGYQAQGNYQGTYAVPMYGMPMMMQPIAQGVPTSVAPMKPTEGAAGADASAGTVAYEMPAQGPASGGVSWGGAGPETWPSVGADADSAAD